MTVSGWLLSIGAMAPTAACAYLLLLTLCSKRRAVRRCRPRTRFGVIVPAHDEEAGIGATIASLRQVAYPSDLYSIVVVADNCTDRTAEVARRAGASVLSRCDPEHPGKGRALAYAFEQINAESEDAVVVVDADTVVSRNLLTAFDARLQSGAKAVQCNYTVRNPHASWRTLLMTIALGSFHTLRSLGRERLGVSCGLRGNGMCIRVALLRDVPHDAFSIVEDVEYGIRLGEAGHRVGYAPEASVFGEMVTGERASRSQRHRWEVGRARLRRCVPRLLVAAARKCDAVRLDLAVDLLVPPLASLLVMVVLGTMASCVEVGLGAARESATALAMWTFCWGCLVAYVARGWQLSDTGARGLWALVYAPLYVLWKIVLRLRRDGGPRGWVRTARNKEAA